MINLFHGDCLEIMKDIPDKSVDLILCDLPYGTTDCKWDKIIPFNLLWEQYERVLKNKGAAVLFSAQPFTTKLINSNLKHFRYCWYWKKNNITGFSYARFQPMRCIEDICVFILNDKNNKDKYIKLRKYFFTELEKSGLTRSEINKMLGNTMSSHYFTMGQQFTIPSESNYKKLQSTGYFQKPYTEIKKEFSAEEKETSIYHPQGLRKLETPLRVKGVNCDLYGDSLNKTHIQRYTNYPTHLLEFPGVQSNKRLHPTQKPVALLEYLVKTYTNEGDTVLDNCMGSGSTGEACRNTNRKFIGIEFEQKYFDIAKKRLAA